jgi:hypothetical protein
LRKTLFFSEQHRRANPLGHQQQEAIPRSSVRFVAYCRNLQIASLVATEELLRDAVILGISLQSFDFVSLSPSVQSSVVLETKETELVDWEQIKKKQRASL